MMNIKEMLEQVHKVEELYNFMSNMDEIAFLSFIGTTIDRYGAEHGVPALELHDKLNSVAHQVFEELGEFQA